MASGALSLIGIGSEGGEGGEGGGSMPLLFNFLSTLKFSISPPSPPSVNRGNIYSNLGAHGGRVEGGKNAVYPLQIPPSAIHHPQFIYP